MDKYREYRFDAIIEDTDRSALQKYQDLVVGNRRWLSLLYYELCTTVFGPVPGLLGLALRRLAFGPLFARTGRKVVFGHHVSLRAPKRIHIGDNTVIDDFAMLSFRGTEEHRIELGSSVLIGRMTMIKSRHGSIDIGDHVHVGPNCLLGSAESLTIGAYTLIGFNCAIGGLQHGIDDADKPIVQQQLVSRGGVHIGRDVWIGTNVSVMDGVRIGDGAVIGAGSVVTQDIPAGAIAVGAPARVIRERGATPAKPG